MERGFLLLFAALMVFTPSSALDVTREGCGTTRLCVSAPDNCDPAGSNNCLFVAIEISAANTMLFRLRGGASYFVSVGLARDPSQGETSFYTCEAVTRPEDAFQHFIKNNNNGQFQPSPNTNFVAPLKEFSGGILKCTFGIAAASSSPVRASQDFVYVVLLGTGTGNQISSQAISLTTGPLDLSNPRANLPTTTSPTTTNTNMVPTNSTMISTSVSTNTTMVATNTTMVSTTAANGSGGPHAPWILGALTLLVTLRG